MKKLTLIRHAKSDWDNDLSDFDRPLNSRGKKEAPIMAKYVKDNLPKVDLIISSPATRAEETAIAFAKENDYPIDKIIFADELYLCSISEYIEILEKQNIKTNHIFVISHNPGTTGFANIIADDNIDEVPTCAVVHIELDILKWNDIEPGVGTIKKVFTPKTI